MSPSKKLLGEVLSVSEGKIILHNPIKISVSANNVLFSLYSERSSCEIRTSDVAVKVNGAVSVGSAKSITYALTGSTEATDIFLPGESVYNTRGEFMGKVESVTNESDPNPLRIYFFENILAPVSDNEVLRQAHQWIVAGSDRCVVLRRA